MVTPQLIGLGGGTKSRPPIAVSLPRDSSILQGRIRVMPRGGELTVSPILRFTSGNTTETFRYYEENHGRPWNELEIKHRLEDPNGLCMVACIIEWGPSQTIDKRSQHPPAENEYITKVNKVLMYAGLETLFLGSKEKDSHTIWYFTLRQNLTTARDRRKYVPFPTKKERLRNRKARQEVNRLKDKAKGTSKGQGKTKSKVKGKKK